MNLKTNKKQKRKTLRKCKPPETLNIEHELFDFITYNRKLGNPIIIWNLIVQLIKNNPTYKNKQKMCYT